MIEAASSTAVSVPVGGLWVLDVDLVDVDGPPTVTVTLPDATTASPGPVLVEGDRWRTTYTPTAPGRYVATISDGAGDLVAFAAYAVGITTAAGMPTADDVAADLGSSAASWSTADIADALDAESAAQRAVCDVPAAYPADLRAALLRRAKRNLALRRMPLAMPTADGADGAPPVIPGRDPEVRRYEAPYRRMVIA